MSHAPARRRSIGPHLCALLLITAICASGSPLHAQDPEAAAARYDAAIEWVSLVMEGEYEAAAERAHPSVADRMSASALEQAWTPLEPQLGSLLSLEPKNQTMQEGLAVVTLTGVWEDVADTEVQVYMGEDHRVAGFFVRPPGG